jgi:hypothetical protein
MTFGERMRELLEQGAQVSKEILAKAGEKAQDWGEKGYQASKDFVNKAGAKAQDLGEKGVLKLEIHQLEGQAQKLISRLGAEAYRVFAEEDAETLSRDLPAVKALLSELSSLREAIEKREAELQNKKI